MQFTRRRVLAGLMTLAVGSVVATADPPKPELPPIDPATQLVPAPLTPVVAPIPSQPPQLESTKPVDLTPPLPAVLPVNPQLPPLPAKVESPPPAPPKPVEAVARKETVKASNVKVVLLLGDAQPKFDVYCGDDAVLKVSCDKVDVRTPGENSAMTPLKGAGHVSFTLPGHTGTCDEILVNAGSGEIIITGNVKLISKSGKVESEIHGTTVRFRLSAAPAANVIGPGTATINLETMSP